MFVFLKKVYSFAKKYVLPLIFAIIGMYFVRFIAYVIRQAGWRGSALSIVEDLFYTFLMMSVFATGAIALIKKNEKLFRAFFVIVFSAMFFSSIAYVFDFIRYFGGYGAVAVINAILTSLCAMAVLLVGVLTVSNYVKGEKKYGEIIDVAVAVYVALKLITFILLLVANIVNGNIGTENVNPLTCILQAFLFIAIYDDVSGRLDGVNTAKESVSEDKSEQSATNEPEKETPSEEREKQSVTEEPAGEEGIKEEEEIKDEKDETSGEVKEEVGEEVKEEETPSEEVAEENNNDAEKPKKEKRGLFSRRK